MKDLKKLCYEKYQLYWMMEHGHSLDEIFQVCKEALVGSCLNGTADSDANILAEDIRNEFLYERGFNGSMFVCYEEFLGAEFRDRCYMKEILSPEEYDKYLVLQGEEGQSC